MATLQELVEKGELAREQGDAVAAELAIRHQMPMRHKQFAKLKQELKF